MTRSNMTPLCNVPQCVLPDEHKGRHIIIATTPFTNAQSFSLVMWGEQDRGPDGRFVANIQAPKELLINALRDCEPALAILNNDAEKVIQLKREEKRKKAR